MIDPKKELISKFFQEHPESAAAVLVRSEETSLAELVEAYDPLVLANVFNRVPALLLSEGLLDADNRKTASLFSQMELTLVARILRKWSQSQKKEKYDLIIPMLEQKISQKIKNLNDYSEDVVASLMNPTPFTVTPDLTLKDVLSILKRQKSRYSRYVYVVNSEKLLLGVIPFKDTFYDNNESLVSEVMSSNIYSLNVNTAIENALKDSSWFKWDSLPVTNSKGQIQGVLKYDVLSHHTLGTNLRNKNNDSLLKAGDAVGEVLQIGLNATISAFRMGKKREGQ